MENNFSKYANVKSNLIFGNLERSIPKVTFLIPTYKRPTLVMRAVESVLKQKTNIEYDIIVVDNEAERGTETESNFQKICSKHQNIYYYKNEENIQCYPNWNRCYELARSEWCCFLMSDDELKPNYLERVVNVAAKRNLDCVHVGSDILDINNNHIKEKNFLEKKYLNRPNHIEKIRNSYYLFYGALPPCGMLIRRDLFIKTGGYNIECDPPGDFDFDTRARQICRIGLLWERLCLTHLEQSTSMNEQVMKDGVVKTNIIKKRVLSSFYGKKIANIVADVDSFVALDIYGFNIIEIPALDADLRYNKWILKTLFRGFYRINKIRQVLF